MMRGLGAASAAVLMSAGVALADEAPVAEATFTCDDSKSIEATFYADKVHLVLSDGRTLDVPQAMSANGGRYATEGDAFVFWNVGDTATITEGNPDKPTFANCVAKKS